MPERVNIVWLTKIQYISGDLHGRFVSYNAFTMLTNVDSNRFGNREKKKTVG